MRSTDSSSSTATRSSGISLLANMWVGIPHGFGNSNSKSLTRFNLSSCVRMLMLYVLSCSDLHLLISPDHQPDDSANQHSLALKGRPIQAQVSPFQDRRSCGPRLP